MTDHLRVFEPGPGILAFYDGRVEGYRFDPKPNWVDDGAISLGLAVFAIVDGDEALVYDTGTTLEHGEFIREELDRRGATQITIFYSHWHLDHVAGTEAFAGSPVLSGERTAEHLREKREAIEAGTLEGPPAISPLIMPTRTFAGPETLTVGEIAVELIPVDIHSDDQTVLWLPERRLLFCGDTMEDAITYVGEPDGLDIHLRDLERLAELEPSRILPSHGSPERIAAGGYPPELNDATRAYIRLLQRMPAEPELREAPLRELIADSLDAGTLIYFEPYERVHRHNVEAVLSAGGA
jgi:glyoxylase-like metal-dependent hydrolase (beta-lactamase superfamily II)